MREGVVDDVAETRPAMSELRTIEVRVPAPALDYCVRIAAGLPRRSSRVWSFTAAFSLRNLAQGNTERQRSMIVESRA